MTEAYLGHRNIQNTTRYTALAPESVQNLYGDSWIHFQD